MPFFVSKIINQDKRKVMNYKKILFGVPDELKNLEDKGKAASYIPEPKNVDQNKLGINLTYCK